MFAFLSKIGLGWLAGLIRGLVSDWRRDRTIREAGYRDAVEDSENAADERKAAADAARDDWDSLNPVERERLRNARKHYRD